MAGGYVSGRKFITDSEYQAAIDDAKLVQKLKSQTDFNNPKSVINLYSALQSGEFRFKTIIGRDFDDEIYELTEKIKADEEKKNDPVRNEALINAEAKKILRKRNKRRSFIVFIAGIIAFGSLGYFGIYINSMKKIEQEYEELASLKGTEPDEETEYEEPTYFTLGESLAMPPVLAEYKNLYKKNNNIVGWLTIDDTNIDYPVMQTDNNEYYLNHDFNNNEDRNGALFADYQCNIPFRSTNIIVYGHHMKSGKMFGNLKKYRSEDFYRDHNIIHFDTIFEKGTYEVMYVFTDKIKNAEDVSFKYYQFIEAISEEEFESNMNAMAEMSLYNTGITAHYGDQLLTLSTCAGTTSTERFVVVAKKVTEITEETN